MPFCIASLYGMDLQQCRFCRLFRSVLWRIHSWTTLIRPDHIYQLINVHCIWRFAFLCKSIKLVLLIFGYPTTQCDLASSSVHTYFCYVGSQSLHICESRQTPALRMATKASQIIRRVSLLLCTHLPSSEFWLVDHVKCECHYLSRTYSLTIPTIYHSMKLYFERRSTQC